MSWLVCFVVLLSLPESRDFLPMSVYFVSCRALPGDFGLMSLPLCCFSRLTKDRPVSIVFLLTVPRVFGLMSLPVFVVARVVLPEL